MPEDDPSEPSWFFERDGDRLVPSAWTRGPWDPRFQHGGPPSALLGRAVERLVGQAAAPARLWIELRRPVPIAPLRVEARIERAGRTTLSVSAALLDGGGMELVRASVLLVVRRDLEVAPPSYPPPEPPTGVPSFTMPFFVSDVGYHRAMDLRIARGTWGKGPVLAWLRMRCPLVVGEQPTALQRVLCAADSVHGVAPPLDLDLFTFVNPDLAVQLSRLPLGEWVGLDAWSTAEPGGLGLARSTLVDEAGPIGATTQSLVVARREERP